MDRINITTYEKRLQSVALSDSEWKYGRDLKLPEPNVLDRHSLITAISLVSAATGSNISIRLQKLNPNRATQGLKPSDLLSVSFSSFRPSHDEKGEPTRWTTKETTGYITRLLRTGVEIHDIRYNFYGYSNSQLKSRTTLLLAAPKDVITQRIESFGDFSKMKTVAKKAKRIGLLFSSAEAVMTVDPARCEDVPDVENDNYIFTDGCGLISPRFAQELSRRLRICFRAKRYSPSVFQIRYKGYKGVLTIDPTMKDPRVLMKFRKSMKKFTGGDDNSFSIVEYAKPYVYGHLNDEVVILLNSLGISAETLLRKQKEHFAFLELAPKDPLAAFRFLCHVNKPDLAEKLLLESIDAVKPEILKLVKAEKGKMLSKRDTQKCRILVPKSRLLFGVCDAWGVLKPGECHVKVTTDLRGEPQTLINAHVLVTRNPCLHPGDLQKLKVVEHPALAHLVDCIVFPIKGKRPSADMMSGGDLDGDTFFVSWDEDLIPSRVAEPALYPGAREPVTFKPITDDDRLQFFAQYSSISLGRVKNLYLDWVKVKGPMAPECQELNRLFSQCVDGNRIKVPPKLEKTPDPSPDSAPFILDVLHEAAVRRLVNSDLGDLEGYDFDAVELLLNRVGVAISEFELIQLAFKWCRKNDTPLQDLLHLFDFNRLSAEEKTWTINQVPTLPDVPNNVMNALCSSGLLTVPELKRFGLNHPRVGWKRVYDSAHERMATFLEATSKYMELFHRKLIITRVDERLTVAIYVPKKIERSQDCLVDNHVRVFAFPHNQGAERQSRLCLPTKMNYRLYSDDNTFQLFEQQRSNTWIHIRHGGSDDSSYRGKANTGDRRRQRQETLDQGQNFDFIVSVALNKFSQGLLTHIGRVNRNAVHAAEVYVITNRDVQSMEKLDRWLQYIDTDEVMPLFNEEPNEYSIPTIASVDLALEPKYIACIAREDLSILSDIDSEEQLSHLFTWLYENDARDLLLKAVDYLFDRIAEPGPALAPSAVLNVVFSTLEHSPFLSVCFSRIDNWTDLPGDLGTQIENRAPDIIRGFILSANNAQELVLDPMRKTFSQIGSMSSGIFAELVELVALTVRSPGLALDILLECFEPEANRLLESLDPLVMENFKKNLIGTAMDHIGEVDEEAKDRDDLLSLKLHTEQMDRNAVVISTFRIDSPGGTPEASAHVRLTVASPPMNTSLRRLYSMDALVTYSEKGMARFRCLHPLPPYFEKCSWRLTYGASFVTTKAMLTAITAFAANPEAHCPIWSLVLGMPSSHSQPVSSPLAPDATETAISLNASQRAAVKATLESPLVCLWGPPGTGKTQTIAAAIVGLEKLLPKARILITAPTHNAVDNVMRRYLSIAKPENQSVLRISTEIRKVADDLRSYTLDAMAGEEIYSNPKNLREAERRAKKCRLAFTTCVGAGIGLLRKQMFEVVIIDEASQQTEPVSLVPLTKGCQRALLVGDHVQLRPTVQKLAAALDFDVSLFERLYTKPLEADSIPKIMLDTQYRMHPSICSFSSDQFYDGNLHTGISPVDRPLDDSVFPWPERKADRIRTVFIQCSTLEDPFSQRSKTNQGQAEVCQKVCKLLSCTRTDQDKTPGQSIAVLTPYSKQLEVLKSTLVGMKNIEVSSIDGYQGREADIVVFVTTRCNIKCEIGFLKDLRRMNVALTRARAGLIVIGHRETLTQGTADPESTAMWKRLLESLTEVKIVT